MAPKSKKKEVIGGPPKSGAVNDGVLPKWPLLQPLVPASDLFLETLVEDQILLVRNLWTSKLCKDYVWFLSSLPLTVTPGKPKRGEAVRVNDRFQIQDPMFAQNLWNGTAMKELVSNSGKDSLWGGEVVGLNTNIRVYRYKPGQFFAQHCE